MKDHIKKIKLLGACSEGIAFADKYDTWQEVWDNIPRGDWSLWLLGKLACNIGSPERKKLVGVLAEGCEFVLPIFEKSYPDDKRVRECIEVLKRYSLDLATIDEVRAARFAAAAAADAAYAFAAAAYAVVAVAAVAAAAVAYAAGVGGGGAAFAAAAAAYADDAYAYAVVGGDGVAAVGAAYADARKEMQQKWADLVRKHYPVAPAL